MKKSIILQAIVLSVLTIGLASCEKEMAGITSTPGIDQVDCIGDANATSDSSAAVERKHNPHAIASACDVPTNISVVQSQGRIEVRVEDVYDTTHIYAIEFFGGDLAGVIPAWTYMESPNAVPGNYVRWFTYNPGSFLHSGVTYTLHVASICYYDPSPPVTMSNYSAWSVDLTFTVL